MRHSTYISLKPGIISYKGRMFVKLNTLITDTPRGLDERMIHELSAPESEGHMVTSNGSTIHYSLIDRAIEDRLI